jgi:hypothetical protein
MTKDEENKKSNESNTAEDIAKIMVENMKANMANPDFLNEQERIRDKVRAKVIQERKERREREQKNNNKS